MPVTFFEVDLTKSFFTLLQKTEHQCSENWINVQKTEQICSVFRTLYLKTEQFCSVFWSESLKTKTRQNLSEWLVNIVNVLLTLFERYSFAFQNGAILNKDPPPTKCYCTLLYNTSQSKWSNTALHVIIFLMKCHVTTFFLSFARLFWNLRFWPILLLFSENKRVLMKIKISPKLLSMVFYNHVIQFYTIFELKWDKTFLTLFQILSIQQN